VFERGVKPLWITIKFFSLLGKSQRWGVLTVREM
jgi:hypothetical protein